MVAFTIKQFLSFSIKRGSFMLLFFCMAFAAKAQIAEIRSLQASLPAIKDSIKYVDALNRIGLLLHTKSADSCFYYGMKAQTIAERLHYNKGRAEALVNIAITLTLKGMHSQGLSYYIQARNLFIKQNLPEPATELLMNCAISYDFLGNYDRSLEFANRALKESAKLKKDSVKSMLIANYVNLDTSLTEQQANKYLDSAMLIANRYKDDRTILFIKQLKAYTLLDNNKPDEALPYIRQSIAIARGHQLEYHEMEGLYVYASYYKAKGKADSALNCYQTIYKMALENNYVFWQIEILELLKNAYKQKNDISAQLRANDSLVSALKQQNESNNHFIGDYIEYNKTQQELSKYKVDYSNKQWQIRWLAVLIVVVAAGTLFIYLMYRRSQKYGKTLNVLNKKISIQNDELQHADEFKSKLISMLAHDFRSPLSSAISMMRLVRDDEELGKEELEVLYNSIETDMQNILLTFDNILQWVKKQMAGFVYTPETLSVKAIMEDATTIFKDVLQVKNVSIINKVPDELSIITDKEVVQFINRNLIHNAIKFSPEGAEIILDAKHSGNGTTFSVEDNGRGMTPAQLDSLFSFNTAPTDSYNKGAGIALTICKEFVDKLRGRIWAESKPGKGSVFYFTLPDAVNNTNHKSLFN